MLNSHTKSYPFRHAGMQHNHGPLRHCLLWLLSLQRCREGCKRWSWWMQLAGTSSVSVTAVQSSSAESLSGPDTLSSSKDFLPHNSLKLISFFISSPTKSFFSALKISIRYCMQLILLSKSKVSWSNVCQKGKLFHVISAYIFLKTESLYTWSSVDA